MSGYCPVWVWSEEVQEQPPDTEWEGKEGGRSRGHEVRGSGQGQGHGVGAVFQSRKHFGFYLSVTSLGRILSRGDTLFNLHLSL